MFGNTDINVTGSLNGVNSGLKQCLTKLNETFAGSAGHFNPVTDFTRIMQNKALNETYMDILTEDYAEKGMLVESTGLTEQTADEMTTTNNATFRKLLENTRNDILNEAQTSGQLKPIVGLTMPLLKLYWVKNVFKDFISTEVAENVAFKRAIERQYVVGVDGTKYYLPEAFIDPSINLFDASRQKLSTDTITVPALGFDLIKEAGGSTLNDDQISPLFYINSVTYEATAAEGETPAVTKTVSTRIKAEPGTGMFKENIVSEDGKIIDILMGDVDFATGLINISNIKGKITGITVDGALSSENHLRTLSVGWDKEEHSFHIPDGIHMSTGLTQERIKDENVIYNIDSQAKIISQMNEVLAQVKDNNILNFITNSSERIKGTDLYVSTSYDCKPPANTLATTPTEWNKVELKETLDRVAMDLGAILQNENVRISVLGHPKDIRLLDSVQWIYGKDSEVGGCKLGYNIGLYNNQRNFLIGSSWKMPQGKIRLLLEPLDETQITYKMWEYQFFISNDYREDKNLRVPAVTVSERYLIDEVTPVGAEIEIKNNKNSSSEIYQSGN